MVNWIGSSGYSVNDYLITARESVFSNGSDAGGDANINQVFAVRESPAADGYTAIGDDHCLTCQV